MTTEVLTQTLARYADETTEIGRRAIRAATEVNTFTKLMDTLQESVGSGWAQTFELIFGDFEESKALWTGINDAMGVNDRLRLRRAECFFSRWSFVRMETVYSRGYLKS